MRGAMHAARATVAASLLLLAAAAGLGLPAAARATTLQPLSVAQLSRHAVAVVQGTVVSTTVQRTPAGVRTDVRLRVARSFKGAHPAAMTVNVPGGVLPDGSRLVVSGMPAFYVGESTVVFTDVFGRLLGGFQGALTVVNGRLAGSGETLQAFGRRVDAALGRRTPAPAGRPAAPEAPTPRGAASAATAIAAPTVMSITPASASAGTDSLVTISGDGFGATRGSVMFSYGRRGVTRIASTSIRSWSPTSITCVVPTGVIEQYAASAGSGPVVVLTALGEESNAVDFSVPFGYGGAKWSGTTVTYLVNTSGVDTGLRTSLLDAGAEMWNQIGAHFSFRDGGTTTAGLAGDGVNVVSWGNDLEYGVLASTYASVDGHVVREIDVRFSNAVAWGEGTPGSNTYDIQSVASHELGHWLELLDQYMPADSTKVMYGYGDEGQQRRTPAPGDIAGIMWVYSGGPAPTPTATPTVTPTPTASPTPSPTPGDVGPVCTARDASVRRGGICRIQYKVIDDASLVVTRHIRITTTAGVAKKDWSGLAQSSGAWQSFRFRCDLRKGTYRIVVTAEDLLGHGASVPGRASLTVR